MSQQNLSGFVKTMENFNQYELRAPVALEDTPPIKKRHSIPRGYGNPTIDAS